MTDSSLHLARLKRHLERSRSVQAHAHFNFGVAALDARLGGGLARGALHEVSGLQEDHSVASGFALMLAMRAAADRPILWVREDKGERMHGQLYGPGMIELGANPDNIILISAPDTLSALRAGADILRSTGLGATVIEPFGASKALDLTASRKLVLAAEKSGVAAFILREAGTSLSSAAATRWRIAAAPSQTLPGNAPGHTALAIELVRHRGGVPPFSIMLEWDRDGQVFREAPLLRAVSSSFERRPMAA